MAMRPFTIDPKIFANITFPEEGRGDRIDGELDQELADLNKEFAQKVEAVLKKKLGGRKLDADSFTTVDVNASCSGCITSCIDCVTACNGACIISTGGVQKFKSTELPGSGGGTTG